MHRYKINKTIEQITYIAGNVRTTFASQGNYSGLTSYSEAGRTLLKKAHIVPDEMWKDGENVPQHVWGGAVNIFSTRKNSADTDLIKAFDIEFPDNISEEICIELVVHDWSNAGVNAIYLDDYNEGYVVTTPVNIEDATIMCSASRKYLNFMFDIDIAESFWKNALNATAVRLSGS